MASPRQASPGSTDLFISGLIAWMPQKKVPILQARLRIVCADKIALGPGKAELLRRIQEEGSIRRAAAAMGVSYMRAWTMLKTIASCFKKPLVLRSRGGESHGGASLTAEGRRVLRAYERMEKKAKIAAGPEWKFLRASLRVGARYI